MLPDEVLRTFVLEAPAWILAERSELRRAAQLLPEDATEIFRAYFPAACLAAARFCFVPEISNPPFFAGITSRGLEIPLDFRDMAAITFVDTIALARRFLPKSAHDFLELLFHEMVHVVQYSALGVERFVPEYVYGWARSGRRYKAIPLEEQAYELQDRFASTFPVRFSVEDAVHARFSAG